MQFTIRFPGFYGAGGMKAIESNTSFGGDISFVHNHAQDWGGMFVGMVNIYTLSRLNCWARRGLTRVFFHAQDAAFILPVTGRCTWV